MVKIDQDADYEETLEEIRNASNNVEGARVKVSTYLDDRVRTIGALYSGRNAVDGRGLDVLLGNDKPLRVRVFGQEQKALEDQAARIAQIVEDVEGVRDVAVESPEEQPTLEIEVDLERARKVGIKPGDARRAEAILVQGILVGSVFEDQKVFDVIVQGDPQIAKDPDGVRNLLIDRPDGGKVRLSRIADIREGVSPTVIQRDEVSRKLDITLDISGRSVEDVSEELESRLQDVAMPLEYHAKVVEENVAEEINGGQAAGFALATLIAILLLMQAALRSWRLAALAYLTLPSALLGGVVALVLLGEGITIATSAGLLAVLALAVRHILVGLDPALRTAGGSDAMLRRFTPVVTSALATAGAALPFAVLGPRVGLEILQPMAVVVLGGLVTTVVHALIVVPALAAALPPPEPDPDADVLTGPTVEGAR